MANIQHLWCPQKKAKRSLLESDSYGEAADFSRFIVIEFLEEEIRNGNLLVEVGKMKIFHTTKCKCYPHKKLNTSKGVIRSSELALASEEEMSAVLGKQGVINIKRIRLEKEEKKCKPTPSSCHSNNPIFPRRTRSAITYIGLNSTSRLP